MGRKLWFIGRGKRPIGVFPSQRGAEYELDALVREADKKRSDYKIYAVEIDDLEEHPAELTLAENEGLI